MSDRYHLKRFVDAQEDIYAGVLQELKRGAKTGHWIWYIFPQISGLGRSALSRRYAIASIDEAKAYVEHPILGARLIECTRLVNAVEGKTAEQIFGYPDWLKFRSCMTLFAGTGASSVFQQALDRYFDSEPDRLTVQALGSH